MFLLRKIKYLLLISIFFTAATHSRADDTDIQRHQEEHSDLLSFLNQNDTIRVFVGVSPGYGHQGHHLTLITRLRELGFNGQVHVVYDNSDQFMMHRRIFNMFNRKISVNLRSNALKFGDLLEGFDPNLKYQELKNNIIYEDLEHFEKSDAKRIALGMSAGIDKTKNVAQTLNSETAIVLNHAYWFVPSYIVTLAGNYQVLPRDIQTMPIKIPEPTEAKTPEILGKLDGSVGWMPVYGIDREIDAEIFFRALDRSKDSLLKTFGNGVIVPVFGTDVAQYQKILDSLGIHTASFDEVVTRGYNSRNKLTVVEMGSVLNDEFYQYFSKANISPVVSGKNTMSLMEQKGIPYISAIRQARELPEDKLKLYWKDKYHEKLIAVSRMAIGGHLESENEKSVQYLSEFFQDSGRFR